MFKHCLRALPAHEMAARPVRVVPPGEVEPDWAGAGRRLAREGAGRRPKIHQLADLSGYWRMLRADEQAALALAQRAADQAGEPVLLAHRAARRRRRGMTLRQIRELLGSGRAREAVAAALASAPELPSWWIRTP